MKRYLYLALGMLIMALAGAFYVWSLLNVPIAREFSSWSSTQLSGCFTLCMIAFCLGGFFNARILAKTSIFWGLFVCMALYCGGIAVIVLCNGSIWNIYLGFGVMIGFSTGIVYNLIVANVVPWFPNRVGVIAGALLMSIGIGSFILGKVYQHLIYVTLMNWRSVFAIYGVLIFAFFMLGAIFIKRTASSTSQSEILNSANDYTAAEMIRCKTFWIYFIWGIFAAGAGYVLIAHANGIVHEVSPQISPSAAATMVGIV